MYLHVGTFRKLDVGSGIACCLLIVYRLVGYIRGLLYLIKHIKAGKADLIGMNTIVSCDQ